MSHIPVHIAGGGILSPLGSGLAATEAALRANRSALAPLAIFPLLQGMDLPVGQVKDLAPEAGVPRAHLLARKAAQMAMAGSAEPPDAIILGSTTGGILTTEHLLRSGESNREAYRHHGLFSLAEDLADQCRCTGPALCVSTACSSGAVAITLALHLLRTGRMRRILAGGVDSLSRLTFFGFHSLQLVDRHGCRPLDVDRQGLAVAEGAAMLLLTTEPTPRPLATLLGAGLSCDAFHPTAPHPEGRGAQAAMRAALVDAGLLPDAVDYINLHGTGTPDNDLAEARAIGSLFPAPPPVSSIKGATGHSLAASGAIEAVVSCLAVAHGLIPGTVGCRRPDPTFGFSPQQQCVQQPVATVLSNSFGFGGNNACLVIGRPGGPRPVPGPTAPEDDFLAIHGSACLSGAGLLQATLTQLECGLPVAGMLGPEDVASRLPAKLIRRSKRFARLALVLADAAQAAVPGQEPPTAVFMGTGWGALTETWDFLHRLHDSGEQFPSPTDFVGSVHNSAAGQVAMRCQATGANVTTSGGDYSFEQALLTAQTLLPRSGQSALLLAADEGHATFSPLLDPSVTPGALADGGGAWCVDRKRDQARCLARLAFYGRGGTDDLPERLVAALGGKAIVHQRVAAVLAGVPAAARAQGNRQLCRFFELIGAPLPLCRYRDYTGEFASASAVAAVMAVAFIEAGRVPGALVHGADIPLAPGDRLLVLGTGPCLTAMELVRP